MLDIGGYDGAVAVQSAGAETSILWLNTFLPAGFFIIAMICVWRFPLTKARHHMLQKAVDEGVHADDNDPKYDELKILI